MEKFIMANGCALRVTDTLKGSRTVLLLHGYLESLDVWEDFAKLLKKDLRVVAMDLPGHGISQVMGATHTMQFLAETAVGVLDELGIEKATVVGHSMGGYVALEMLKNHSEHMDGIVLLSSSPNPDSEEKLKSRDREIALVEGGHKDLLAQTAPTAGFAPENLPHMKDEVEFFREQIYVTEAEGVAAILRGMKERADNNETLRQSKVPQLLIFGRNDGYIPVETAEKIIAAQPQARVAWLEHSGHLGFMEEPEACATAILDFVESI